MSIEELQFLGKINGELKATEALKASISDQVETLRKMSEGSDNKNVEKVLAQAIAAEKVAGRWLALVCEMEKQMRFVITGSYKNILK